MGSGELDRGAVGEELGCALGDGGRGVANADDGVRALGLGWFALVVGFLGFYAWAFYEMIRDPELETLPKVLILGGIGGFMLLFLAVLRNRMRELPHDPYTKIQR